MTDRAEIEYLCHQMINHGAKVALHADKEGRIDSVSVCGVPGFGLRMPGLAFAERAREWLR